MIHGVKVLYLHTLFQRVIPGPETRRRLLEEGPPPSGNYLESDPARTEGKYPCLRLPAAPATMAAAFIHGAPGSMLAAAAGKTETHFFAGPAGAMEVLADAPAQAPRGIALVTHPQPLLGGSPRHKIPHRLAHGLRDDGWLALRPAFRGVAGSAGHYDHGDGESEDILALARALRAQAPALPLALVGFSFGAYVQARVARALLDAGTPADRVVLAGLPVGEVPAERVYDTPPLPEEVVLIHGENDAQAPLAPLLEWARPNGHPVIVVPGADHFFSRSLPLLLKLVRQHLAA